MERMMAGVRARLGSLLGPRGVKGEPGARGLPGLEAMPQAEGMAEHIATPGPVRDALRSDFANLDALDSGIVVLSTDRFPGITPFTGSVAAAPDAGPAIAAALAQVPRGSIARIPPGNYCIRTTIPMVRGVTLQGYGVSFTVDAATPLFAAAGSYGATYAAASVTEDRITLDAGNLQWVQRVAVNGPISEGWRRGDLVRLVADDIIPGARPGSGGLESRVGQFLDVLSVTSDGGVTTVTLQGRLLDPMTTGIRLARLNTDESFTLEGITADRSDAVIAAGAASASEMIRLSNAYKPVLRGINIKRNIGPAIIPSGSFGWLVEGCKINWALNDATVSFGYGVMDNQGTGGVFRDSIVHDVRHAYSDDTGRIPAGHANLGAYGRSYNNTIDNVTGVNCSSSAFDTHHASQAVHFVNVKAIGGSSFALGLRGRSHVVRGLTSLGSRSGVRVFTEDAGGESWGHDISGVRVEGYSSVALELWINPLTGTREEVTRETRIRDFQAVRPIALPSGVSVAIALVAKNAAAVLEDFHAEAPAVVGASHDLITTDNSSIRGKAWVADYRANTAGTNLDVLSTGGNTSLELDALRVLQPPAGFGGRMARTLSTTTTDLFRIDRALLDELPAIAVNGSLATGSWVDYHVLTGESSDYEGMTNATATSAAASWIVKLARTRKDFAIEAQVTIDATIPTLPRGHRYGQRLSIVQAGAGGTLRIVHGSAGLTLLSGNANAALTQFGTITLVWVPTSGGRWRQV